MAIKGNALILQYVAWNTTLNVGQPADAGNHAVRAVGDGSEFTPAASPVEVNGADLPGVYKIALQSSETDYNCLTVGGKSSTSNVVLIPVTITTESGAGGSGSIVVDQNYPTAGNLSYQTALGTGIAGGTVSAYLASEWTANPLTAVIRGQTTTLASGAWTSPMTLSAGTYVFVYNAQGYNQLTVTLTVA